MSETDLPPLEDLIRTLRWAYADRCVRLANGNKREAARRLGISLATVYRALALEPTVPVELVEPLLPKVLPWHEKDRIERRSDAFRSGFQAPNESARVVELLEFFGIDVPLRHKFWVVNAGRLDWIFYDAHQAYRRMASECHPDRDGDAGRMRQINDAWTKLKALFRKRGIS